MKKSNFDIENGENNQNQMKKKPLFNTKKEKPPFNKESSEEKTLKESQTILYNPKKQLHKKAPTIWKEGDVIAELYEVKGSFPSSIGVDYLVEHLDWRSFLLVKTLSSELSANEKVFKAFFEEAGAWVDLGSHPNIASCFYARHIGGLPRIFIEYVGEKSLKDWIAEGKVKEWKNVLDLAIQFCRGMEYAHEKGIIHRDIKPANCLMAKDGILKITNLGLIKSLDVLDPTILRSKMPKGSSKEDGSLIITNLRPGTPEYMSPEQFSRSEMPGKAADIYSFGIMLFEMVTGRRPFVMPADYRQSERERYFKRAHLNKKVPNPIKHREDCPELLSELILKCLEKDPNKRTQNYDSFESILIELEDMYQDLVKEPYPRRKAENTFLLAESLNNKGLSFYDLGYEKKALSFFLEAFKIDPYHPKAFYNMTILLWKKQKITDSEVVIRLERLCENFQNDWIPLYLLGLVHMARKDDEGAIFNLYESLKIATKESGPKRALGLVLSEIGNKPYGLLTLEGHSSYVWSVKFSPNGRFALSGSSDNTLCLWYVKTGECLSVLEGHINEIYSVAFSHDGNFALSGGSDGTIKFWDVKTGQCLRTLKSYASIVHSLCFSPDGKFALSGGSDETLRLLNLKTGKSRRTMKGHTSIVYSVDFSPDGNFALSGSEDESVRLWDVKTGKCLRTMKGHTDEVFSVSFSPDGRHALSGGSDGTIKLWDVKTGKCLRTIKGHTDWVLSVSFSHDGKFALSGSVDNTLRLWDVKTGRCLYTLLGHTRSLTSVAFSYDKRFALSASRDKTLRLWDLGRIEPFRPVLALSHVSVSEEEFGLQNRYINLAEEVEKAIVVKDWPKASSFIRKAKSLPGYVRHPEIMKLWVNVDKRGMKKNPNTVWCLQAIKGHTSWVVSVSYCPDGTSALSGSKDNTARLWDIETGECLRVFEGHTSWVECISVSIMGKLVLSGSKDNTARLWDIETGECLHILKAHTDGVTCVAISPDGRFALSGSYDKTLRLWDIETGECLRVFEGHTSWVESVAISPDGVFALSGSRDNTLRLWDIEKGECLSILNGHTESVESVAFSPDGILAISGGVDKTLRLWDIDSGECLRIFEGHSVYVNSVSFSPDGRFVLSGSGDKTLRLWDIETGECLHILKGHTSWVESVSFSPDGRFALSGSRDKTMRMWSFDWNYDFPEEKEWDEGARKYLEIFLKLRNGKWEEEDFQHLIKDLTHRGYGWLKEKGVRKELEIMAPEGVPKESIEEKEAYIEEVSVPEVEEGTITLELDGLAAQIKSGENNFSLRGDLAPKPKEEFEPSKEIKEEKDPSDSSKPKKQKRSLRDKLRIGK